ncbi:AraC-binding-like domain-containing protein [Rathayibacter oskolensis]|uniref:AraC-binding-like domain-containing protein n=1 Tax=Rathayibacter oskolensis TaxID=1891671 RepID=A0A1X7MYC1_9MICO|nr:helix-turn-helix transcriptional regulator [Rathayibacter oskolensis]SMH29886.1 AraC-binding-like domain-containing protein [Rathayibacter oskolensis]
MSVEHRTAALHEQLDAFGWEATSSVDSLRIDGVGAPGAQIGRAWSPGGSYRSRSVPGSMYVLFTIEGTGRVVHDGTEIASEPNQLIFLDGEAVSTIELHGPTARYLWRFDSGALRDSRVRERLGEAIPVRDSLWTPVRALTNGLIDGDPELARSIHAARASEHLLTAIFENTALSARPSRSPDELCGDALQLIAAHKCDPAFTPARLARELQVTERALREAFSYMGSTAAQELDRQRAQELRGRLGAGEWTERDLELHAEECGFVSPASARRALARWALE